MQQRYFLLSQTLRSLVNNIEHALDELKFKCILLALMQK